MPFAQLREASLQYLVESDVPEVRINPQVRAVVESLATKYESEKNAGDGWLNPRFPWRGIRAIATQNPGDLGEAHASTAFGQLLRAGIQVMANSWYRRYPVTYPQIALEITSDKRQEFHAPLFGSAFPRSIQPGGRFRSQRVEGQDIEIINRKFGGMEVFDRELFDDDQTGQIRGRAQNLGEGMGVWEDAYFAVRFVGVASTAYPDEIKASNWSGVNANGTAITVPFSVNMYRTDVGNRPVAYAQLTYGGVLDGVQRLRRAVDPLGVPMVVTPNKILVSSFDEFNVKSLLNSTSFPAVPPATGGADVGKMGGTFMENPLRGQFTPTMNIHLLPGTWAVGEGNKGFCFQRRDPLEIAQEVPNSGESFDTDSNRFRSRARWEQDWIDPRFWDLGNDGTAAVSQV